MFLIASRFPTPPLACAFFSSGATVTWCTCERCGIDLRDEFCPLCNSGNSCVYDPNPNSFDCPPDSYHPPHPTYETYSYDSYGNDSQFGYDCQPQFPLNHESEQGYNENYTSYPYDSSSFLQQYPCYENCGGPHETFQCQPTNEDYCYEQNSCYNSSSFSFDHCQPPQSSVIHQPPQELSIQEMEDLKQKYLDELKRLKKLLQQKQWAYLSTHPSKRLTSFCYDDDDDYNSAITPVLSTEEPVDSLSMGDEHLDTIPATESDEVIKSSVEDLVPIPISSIDDDSFSIDNINYVEASPPDSELVSSEVMEIVIPEVGGIDDDIHLTIKDDNLRKKLLNVNLLIANIEALKDNPTQFSESLTKSSSTSLNSFLEETNTFHNSLSEFENFFFDLGEISSGSTTTHSDISLSDYEAFYFDDGHIKEISSGSTTTHSDISISEYDSFIFAHEEFVDELAHIISPPKYDCFYFKDLPDP
nr:hypothetical protein [Tanacetum cinerariifolium]